MLVRLLCLLTTAIVCFSSHAQAKTVGGALTTDSVWMPDDGPFIASQSIEVPAGVRLELKPGVVVQLKRYSFVVKGTLIARGTKEAPVTFTSANVGRPAPQDWGLLLFDGNASGAQVRDSEYVSGSILEHVIVEYGQGMQFNAGAPYVSNCTVRFNKKERGGGIYAYNCNPVIRNCEIFWNVAEREGGGFRSAYGKPTLIANRIHFNEAGYGGGGISTDYNESMIVANDIAFNRGSTGGGIATGDTQVGQTSMAGSSHSSPVIIRNTIRNNLAVVRGGGVHIEGSPKLAENLIQGNRTLYATNKPTPRGEYREKGTGAGATIRDTYGPPAQVDGNAFLGNRDCFWGGAINFYREQGVVTNNLFLGNVAKESGGAVSLLMANFRGDDGSLSFSKNSFANNVGGGFSIANDTGQTLSIRQNNLEDESNAILVNRKAPVDAINNWWGTTNDGEVPHRITDGHDHLGLGEVKTAPIAKEPVPFEHWYKEVAEFLAACPTNVRAGQGLNRLPGTPPSVTFVWKPGDLRDVAGYRIYFVKLNKKTGVRSPASITSGRSPADVGMKTRTKLEGFELGTHEFFVTAYDAAGNESSRSDTFTVDVVQ